MGIQSLACSIVSNLNFERLIWRKGHPTSSPGSKTDRERSAVLQQGFFACGETALPSLPELIRLELRFFLGSGMSLVVDAGEVLEVQVRVDLCG